MSATTLEKLRWIWRVVFRGMHTFCHCGKDQGHNPPCRWEKRSYPLAEEYQRKNPGRHNEFQCKCAICVILKKNRARVGP